MGTGVVRELKEVTPLLVRHTRLEKIKSFPQRSLLLCKKTCLSLICKTS